MPIRIYALAKELKLDSKLLVDACDKAGIVGKGSALASLTDEEAAKLRAFLIGGAKPAARPAGAGTAGTKAAPQKPSALRREDYMAPGATAPGKIPVLGSKAVKPLPAKPPAAGKAEPAPPAAPAPEEPPEKPAKRPAAELAEEPPEKPPLKPPEKPPEKPGQKLPEKPARKPPEKPEKAAPGIKLAPIPTAAQPSKPSKPDEPAPQKPDIRLPRDVIRAAGKAGSAPLAEHIKKEEKKQRAGADKRAAGRGAAAEAAPGAAGATAREKGKRPGRAGGESEEGLNKTLGGREQRQLRRKQAAKGRRQRSEDEDDRRTGPRRIKRLVHTGRDTSQPRKQKVVIQTPCTVRAFSEAIGVPARLVLGKLMSLGTLGNININSELDAEACEMLALELNVDVDFRQREDLEDRLVASFEEQSDEEESLELRPPIVTFLGHVDHGKTSLLDKIIGLDVAGGEKGGITQHIRAYRIEKDGRPIAFVDTPGHEAFTAMRARGANVTDIAVLVVAADDGVMPQTEEAISHARAAGVPIVVALNKIDLPGVNVDRTYQQLAENELLPSEWSGDTEVVKTSAVSGEGVDELLETILTVAELHEYKANPERDASGTCLESEMQEHRGVVAKLLVQSGTLRVGDVIVSGSAYGRVKAMYDTLNPRQKHEAVGPATPVNMTGLNLAPGAGDRFYVLKDIGQAREIAERRETVTRQQELSGGRSHVTLENLFERLGSQGDVQTLNLIIRADTRGSIEAIRKEMTKLEHPEVQIKVLQAAVGGVSEADVHLADASDAVIIGFNVVPDESARGLADQRGVQIRRYDIIYQVTEDLKAALEGMLKPEERELELGRALVKQIFQISRVGTIAGCQVLSGNVQRDSRVRVIRDSRVIGDYALDSLRREKDDAKEVRAGLECGMKLKGFDDLKEGDILEVYRIEEVARTL